jgi:hypothetical protein
MSQGPAEGHAEIKIHPYRVNAMFRTLKRIMDRTELPNLIGPPLAGDEFNTLVAFLLAELPKGVKESALRRSLTHIAGERVTHELLHREVWRILGNISLLKKGQVVGAWVAQSKDEMVPLQIVQMKPWRNRYDQLGAIATFRILAGTPTGLLTTRFFSQRFWYYVSRDLGFNPRSGRGMKNLLELTNLRCYGLAKAKKRLQDAPFIDKLAPHASMLKHNQSVLSKRRREGFKCPKKYEHACFLCPIGYDQCPMGTHPRTYTVSACKVCNSNKAWFDPQGVELRICVDCRKKIDIRKRS